MGGYGSTRWALHDKKATVDSSIRLSVQDIMRRIPPPVIEKRRAWNADIHWLRGTATTYIARFWLTWVNDSPQLSLADHPTFASGQLDWKQHTVIDLQTTPCAYGGRRYWFTCPHCDRRCGCLYIAPRDSRWACRVCHDLTYKSAQTAHEGESGIMAGLSRTVDLILRAEKLEKRLDKHRPGSKAWWRVYHKYAALVDTATRRKAEREAEAWRARVSK